MNAAAPPVALDNCDREPIHIPGRVQAHGALLAFSAAGEVRHASANAGALLGPGIPLLGETLASGHFGASPAVHGAIARMLALPGSDEVVPEAIDVSLPAGQFDLVVHRSGDLVVAEFERRPPGAPDHGAFAFQAHRGMDRLRRQRSLQALLEVAVGELRALTGFDRVMAYRFRQDDSGEVVAESCRDDLEPFLNRRYPASDIPAQARRLYLVNTLRLIADVNTAPVPLQSAGTEALDMSHCVLRSVSPVHIEYLGNLGVQASMSVSIVVNGRLWGMLACHHMVPRQVPYSVRMACDVLGQILAANVQSLAAGGYARRIADSVALRGRLIETLLHAEDARLALSGFGPSLCALFEAGAALFTEEGKVTVSGDLPLPAARSLAAWLDEKDPPRSTLLALGDLSGLPPDLQQALGTWCGLLALQFDAFAGGWLVLLRREQVQTIAWGGRPEKEYVSGPLGPRLTPRGSFDVWRETVRGKAEPWSDIELEIAQQLLGELARATGARNAELNRAKDQLLAVLGHDLRDPLQTISMAASVIERGADQGRLGQRIQTSSTRMQRLISQVLDVSRLQSGFGLGFQIRETDMRKLLDDLLDEAGTAHPDLRFIAELPPTLMAVVDPDRVGQLLGNLLSNARHHGTPGEAVGVRLEGREGKLVLEVRNHAPPIPDEIAASLFSAFKRGSLENRRNKGGLGLGLYIAREIVQGHGGTLDYRHADPHVVFTAVFPLRAVP